MYRWQKIIIWLVILFLMVWGIKQVRDYTLSHPVKMVHPFPKLSKQFPVIEYIDSFTMLTGGIQWCVVIDKNSKKTYLLDDWDYNDYNKKKGYIRIMDYELRDAWIYITEKEYLERFGQSSMGVEIDAGR